MTGLRWQEQPLAALPAARNAFEVTVNGADRAELDAAEMGLDTRVPITGTVTTDRPLQLTLLGAGTVTVPAGTHEVTLGAS
jgi:hypothetical protein